MRDAASPFGKVSQRLHSSVLLLSVPAKAGYLGVARVYARPQKEALRQRFYFVGAAFSFATRYSVTVL